MRVVVDSNVLISIALKSRALAPIREAWVEGHFTLLGSEPLFAELEAVLRRGKFERLIAPKEVNVMLNLQRPNFPFLQIAGPEPFPINPRLVP